MRKSVDFQLPSSPRRLAQGDDFTLTSIDVKYGVGRGRLDKAEEP
jgi:hypothetical protein